MEVNNLRLLYVKEYDDKPNEHSIVDYTYDAEYIKNFINSNDTAGYIKNNIICSGYAVTSVKINNSSVIKSYISDIYYVIINIEDVNNNSHFYLQYLNIFKQLHREYQLKGILDEL